MPNITNALFDIRLLEGNAQKNTALRRLHPLAKLVVTVCFIVCVISFPRYDLGGLLVFAAYPLLMMVLAEAPPGQLLRRLLLVLPVTAAACAANLFLDTQTAFVLGAVAVPYGVLSFFSALAKALLTVCAALVLIATTPISDICAALRQIRLPQIVVTQLLLTYRYIDLLVKEAAHMYTAYKLRAPRQKGIKLRDMGSFLGGLLVRAMERGERVYSAMKLRGFAGGIQVAGARFGVGDALFTAVLCALFAAARLVDVGGALGGVFV